MKKIPTLLCILDGFGKSEKTHGNAIKAANTPNLDQLFATCPNSNIITYGAAVGLPDGQMGNSEVGHMAMGAGRTLMQSLERINAANLTENTQLTKFLSGNTQDIHLIGLLSDGGVHSHTDHLVKLCKYLKNQTVYVHAITDGRDTAPNVAAQQIADFQKQIAHLSNVKIATVCGRFYAMDRDNKLERTIEAWNCYVNGDAKVVNNFAEVFSIEETDEFIKPTIVDVNGKIKPDDKIIFFNFRADRMRQIVKMAIDKGFNIATFTEYDKNFNDKVTVLFPPETPSNTLPEILSKAGKTQLHIAETEKYAHVTFFFAGGIETKFAGEERIVIPSPKDVKTYDLKPEMSLPEVTKEVVNAIESEAFDCIILNIANGDMVGHSGNFEATVKCVEAIDVAVGAMFNAIKQKGGNMLITADHGNCEEMLDDAGNVVTSHSLNPVPFIYFGNKQATAIDGDLRDIAPTILTLMGIKIPTEMTGKCLLQF